MIMTDLKEHDEIAEIYDDLKKIVERFAKVRLTFAS
jgi:hypothetical protein